MKGKACSCDNDAIISVIVPIYNAAFYLKKCLRSILSQTHTNLELILVDDGSTDKSSAICDAYAAKDSRIKVIHNPHLGVSSARNAGLDTSSGKYVTFVDADDWLSPRALEKMLQDMTSRSADISVGMTVTEGVFSSTLTGYCHDSTIHFDDTGALCSYIDEIKEFPGLWGKLMRKDIITQNHLRFNEQMSYGEDTLFIWKYLHFCKIFSTSCYVVYHYSRITENSLSCEFSTEKSYWVFQGFQSLWDLFTEEQRQEQRVKSLLMEKAIASLCGSCRSHCVMQQHNESISAIERIVGYYEPYIFALYDASEGHECIINQANDKNNAAFTQSILSKDYEAVYKYLSEIRPPRKRRIRKMAVFIKQWYVYHLCT